MAFDWVASHIFRVSHLGVPSALVARACAHFARSLLENCLAPCGQGGREQTGVRCATSASGHMRILGRRIIASVLLLLFVQTSPATAQTLDKINIVIFGAPSLGAFLPPVIKARKLDEANGLDITFSERTPDAYATEFNSGEFQVGGSAALLTVGLAANRGVKVQYLFNLFDLWGAVVTSRPEVKTLHDLEGKQLAGARATTNYVMFEFFARKAGVDTSKIEVVNTATPGLVGYALADRADAVQIWEPAYTLLLAKKPDIRTLDQGVEKTWATFAGGSRIPYLGVAAHTGWVAKNAALIPRLYAAYKAAAEWIAKNPDEAAALIAAKSTAQDQKAIASLIRSNERLGMDVAPASAMAKEIAAVYRAGVEIGYFTTQPAADTISGMPLP
jgi:NitT/TauT family transport system substrate-binding protein